MTGKASVPGRGRKPKPAAEKLIAGNPGKRPLPTQIDFSAPLLGVDPPEWLPPLARQMWETVSPELCRAKILNVTDLHNLEMFCAAYSTWREAQQDIAANGVVVTLKGEGDGITSIKKNPAVTVANEALRQVVTVGALLGLDPSSRQRVLGTNTEKEANPFDEI